MNISGGMYNDSQAQHSRPEHKALPTQHVVVCPASVEDYLRMELDMIGHLTAPEGYWAETIRGSITRGVWINGLLTCIFGGYPDVVPGVVHGYFIPAVGATKISVMKILLKEWERTMLPVLINSFQPHRLQTLVNYKNPKHNNFAVHLGMNLEGIMRNYPAKGEYSALYARSFQC